MGDVSLETERIPRVCVCVCVCALVSVRRLHSERAGSPVTMETQGFVATEDFALPLSLSTVLSVAQTALRYASYTAPFSARGSRFVLRLATDAE